MNKKISQFEAATSLQENDILTIVQDNTNKNITKDVLVGSLTNSFATNERVDKVESDVTELDTKVDTNYTDLSNKIVEGDTSVTTNLNSTINSYYDVLNNKIIVLDTKHDKDIYDVNDTVQSWIEDIDNRSTLAQLQEALNRLTSTENIVTALAEIIANGGGGAAPGFHTQPTSTIFPLSGYYNAKDASPLTTTDTLNQALSKLESQIDSIKDSGDKMPVIKYGEKTIPTDGNLYTAAKSREENLSRLYNDTVYGHLSFMTDTQWGESFGPKQDFLGTGAGFYLDSSKKWNLDVDNLFVRGRMTVNELIINQIQAVGGVILVTLASGKCASVQEFDTYYRCYLPEETDNQFVALDQVICQKFNGKDVKRYWRLVVDTGTDDNGKYIDLSKYDCEDGSSIPAVDDEMVQLGNRTIRERQTAIQISAKGVEGPTISMYDYINGYTLEGKQGTTIGRNSRFVGRLVQVSPDNSQIPVAIDKGVYVPGNTYYYYDRVSYDGSLWLCIAQPSTTEAPDKNKPTVWQLQVEKGDKGQSGTDVAKWVEIMGDRLFMYDNPKFEGTPKPARLVLDCNHYGIVNPSYSWVIKNTNTTISTYKSCEITPDLFGDNRNITVRCTVTEGDEEFYDEVQLSKLGDGAQGADAYYIDLSNSSMNVPFDATGTTPLVDLSKIYTDVKAYKGTKEAVIQNITAKTVDGTGEVSVDMALKRVTLKSLKTAGARFLLTITVDNLIFTKDLWVNQSNSGQDGFDGTDASYLMVTGEQLFHTDHTGLDAKPTSITLTASLFGFTTQNCTLQWYYKIVGESDYTLIENEKFVEFVVSPTAKYYQNADEVAFKCVASLTNSDRTYEDIITVSKIRDGKNGENVYVGTLTNEAQTIPATYFGSVSDADILKIKTDFELYYGIDAVQNYTVRRIIVDATNTSEITPTTSVITNGTGTKTLSLVRLDPDKDKTVFKIEFVVDNKVVSVKEFTITKQKGGKPGDFVVPLYAYKDTEPSNRPSMGKIGVPTSAGVTDTANNMVWFLDIPAGAPIWMTQSTYVANDDGTVTSSLTDGYYWTKPVKITGKDGIDGEKGDKGDTGDTGATGAPGEVGQVQTFRGTWESSKVYYLDKYRCDVVYLNGAYYRRIGQYTGTQEPVTNTSFWTSYGGNFETLATGLFLAVEADIAGWKFQNNYIYAQNNSMRLDGRSGQSVRIAAGSNAATNPENAVFRVLNDGSIYCSNANITGGTVTGTINANSGKIGNWVINTTGIENTAGNATLDLTSGNSYFRINTGDAHNKRAVVSVRSDGRYGMSIYAEQQSNAGIYALAQTNARIMEAYGGVKWIQRAYSGNQTGAEYWNMPGLLAIIEVDTNGGYVSATRVWGQGIQDFGVARASEGRYQVIHNANANVTAVAMGTGNSGRECHGIQVVQRNSIMFYVETYDGNHDLNNTLPFCVFIFGRNVDY